MIHQISCIRRHIMLLFTGIGIAAVAILLLTSSTVAGLTPHAARMQQRDYLIFGPLVLAFILALLYWYLRPISDLGYALEIGSTPTPTLARDARRIALNAPINFFVLTAAGSFLLALLFGTLRILGHTDHAWAEQLPRLLLTTAVALGSPLVIALISRHWMRPVLLYTAAQPQEGGFRLNIRARLFAVILTLTVTTILVTGLLGYRQLVQAYRAQGIPAVPSSQIVDMAVALGISGLAVLGIAAAVSHYLAADVVSSLHDVRSRLLDIARDEQMNLNAPLPALSIDEVGDLVAAYNLLQQRVRIQQEQTEYRQRQLMSLQSLSYKIGTTRSIEHLMREVIRDVERAFGYHNASILLVDEAGQELYFAAAGSLSPGMQNRKFKIGQEGIVGHVAATGVPLLINDVSNCDFYISDGTNTRSEMVIPLAVADRVTGNRILGVFDVSSERTSAFSESDLHMMTALGNQIAIVIENARLFEQAMANAAELEQRTRNLIALHDISTALSGSLRMEEVLAIAAQHLVSLFQVEHSTVILFGAEDREGQIAAEYPAMGMAGQTLDLGRFPALRWILGSRSPLFIAHAPHSETVEPIRDHVKRLGIQSMLMVPLLSQGTIKGLITLDSTNARRSFGSEVTDICMTIAAQVAVAIENVRLVQDLNTQADLLARMGRDVAAERSRLDAVLSNLADGLLVTDTAGRILLFNRAFLSLFGLRADGLRGRPLTDVLPEVPLHDLVVQTLHEDTARIQEFSTTSAKFLQVTAAAVREGDQATSVVMLLRDVTNEKQLDRMKSDFISTVSHEFRTPLTSVLGFAKLIRRSFDRYVVPGPLPERPGGQQAVERMDQNLTILVAEIERLSRLVEDVLFLADLDAGRLTWHTEEIEVIAVLQTRIGAYRSEAGAKNLAVRVELPDTLPPVYIDRERLMRVIDNLLSNAMKFTKAGEISIRAQELRRVSGGWSPSPFVDVPVLLPRGAYVLVTISDTGPGISPEARLTLFERFGQGMHDVLTEKPAGTGLGLAISMEIVSHYGGHIWATSTPGQGSTFAFVLPASPVQSKRDWQTGDQTLPANAPAILAVDDDAEARELLYHILFAAGYRTLMAADGPTALNMARIHKPDLIVLDIMIPGITGLDVTSVLKADETTKRIPIVILSALSDRTKATQLGADAYLTKPIRVETLLSTIGGLLKER